MLPFREILLTDRPAFQKALEASPFPNSEMTFASLWMWRSVWLCTVHIADDAIFIREHQPQTADPAHILPVLTQHPLAPHLRRIMDDFHHRCIPFHMRSIDESYRRRLEDECPGWFTFEADENFFDYVYDTADLTTLAGRKYHGKRNHIAQFLSRYQGQYREMTEADAPACMNLYDRWAQGRSNTDELAQERRVIGDALANLSALTMRCGAIIIDGRVEAFSLGERVRDTAIIHTEKANTEFEGLYAYMNQQFAQHAFGDTRLINREEDMGIEGLRRAKSSYHPSARVVKYIARPVEEAPC